MFESFKRAVKEQGRRDKISKSVKKYHAEHGCTRKVPVCIGGDKAFIYLSKKEGFKRAPYKH